MASALEEVGQRFFTTFGLVEEVRYRTFEVLLDESVQPYFQGRDHLLLTFSAEVAREDPKVEVLAYGSPLLASMTEASLALGAATHVYLKGLGLTAGRTLEKVSQHTRIPGQVLEKGQEEPYLYHHCAFRFRVALASDSREESFHDVAVDLHSGWTTTKLGEQTLRVYGSEEPEFFPEANTVLSLAAAYGTAVDALRGPVTPLVRAAEQSRQATALEEKRQLDQHYESMLDNVEAGRARRGANLDRIEERRRSIVADRERRVEDMERKYRVTAEAALVQVAVVSYPKMVQPLRLRQGKAETLGMAVWDPLVHEGYFHPLPS